MGKQGNQIQEQENPGFGKPWFSYLPLFFFTLEVTTGSSLQILDVDFCGGGDTGSGQTKQLTGHEVGTQHNSQIVRQPDHLRMSSPLTQVGQASAHTHLKTEGFRKIPPKSSGLRRNLQESVEIRQGLHSAA